MIDLMSGGNSPVAKAMEWCGWTVQAYDWAISPDHDLSDPKLQDELKAQVGAVDMWMVAMDCSTFSRARERPIPGHPNPPKPLRGANNPLGVPSLSASDKERVHNANNLVHFFTDLLTAAHNTGAAGALENPRRAWIWTIPAVKELLQLPGWQDFEYHSCSLGGARAKAQTIRANIDEFKALRCECHHVHHHGEWKPHKDAATGRWIYPSSQEQEYTAELAFGIAIAASAWACRVGRARLYVPRPLRPSETGSRVEWLAFPPSAARADAMPGLAARLGLAPRGPWADIIPQLSRTKGMKDFPPGAVYIGQGNLALKLAKSQWASPFRPGPHGTPEACVRKYSHWLATQQHLLQQVPSLRGRQLLCDCEPQEPCHGEALIAEVLKACGRAPSGGNKANSRRGHDRPVTARPRPEQRTATGGSEALAILEPRPRRQATLTPRTAVVLLTAAAARRADAQPTEGNAFLFAGVRRA